MRTQTDLFYASSVLYYVNIWNSLSLLRLICFVCYVCFLFNAVGQILCNKLMGWVGCTRDFRKLKLLTAARPDSNSPKWTTLQRKLLCNIIIYIDIMLYFVYMQRGFFARKYIIFKVTCSLKCEVC